MQCVPMWLAAVIGEGRYTPMPTGAVGSRWRLRMKRRDVVICFFSVVDPEEIKECKWEATGN
jgi:hypothetical protein